MRAALTYPRWIQWTRQYPEAATALLALTLTPDPDPVHPVTEAYSAVMLRALQRYQDPVRGTGTRLDTTA